MDGLPPDVGPRKMDGLPPDVRSLWYEMKNQNKDLRRKRLWLMGFPEPAESSRKRLKSNKESILPETMLREDDLFYESLMKHVQNGFGVCQEGTDLPTTHDAGPFMQHRTRKTILALLDDFTSNGLYLLANALAESSIMLEKTRRGMKKFIKENMPKVLEKQCSRGKEGAVHNKLSQILRDPRNFRKKHVMLLTPISNLTNCPTVQSHYDAFKIVLDCLKDMSLQTLGAMHGRLTGVKGSLPVLNPPRSGWTKGRLANRVKSLSLKMLSKLDSLDELPEPVIKAMEVACLSLKLSDHQNASVTNFCSYSPEIESLQNEIVKAINLLNCEVGVQELKGLKDLLSPGSDCKVLNGGLRKAIKRMLTEFLYECSEMDEIPIVLLDTLAVINGCATRQKEATEEVESILNVSAHIKQVYWDFLADCELDLEFTNAYMEDLEESDDGELSDDYNEEEELVKKNLDDDISEVGSTADSHGVDSSLAHCTPTWNVNSRSVGKSESVCKTEIKVEPDDDLLFTPSFGVSKSFNHTASVDSKLYQTQLSKHMAGTKDSVSRFSLSSTPFDQTQGKTHCQSSSKVGSANIVEDPTTRRNKYLAIQQASDETSLFAYRLIGHVLEGYAHSEELDLGRSQLSYLNDGHLFAVDLQGTVPNEDQAMSAEDVDGSILIQAVGELIPSFPNSELEKVRKILR